MKKFGWWVWDRERELEREGESKRKRDIYIKRDGVG